MEPWWTMQQSGLIGGSLGAAIGVIFGGIGGGIGGPLAGKGRAKGFVVGLYAVGIVAGAALVIAGVVAKLLGQPYHVWYPVLLPGVLLASLTGILLPVAILPAYRRHEQRRLAAEELRRA